MVVTIRLFSIARELAGFQEKSAELPEASCVGAVMEVLKSQNALFGEWQKSMRLAVNEEYVPFDHILRDGDEVAVIPPVSGG